jgi:hypothetical protein
VEILAIHTRPIPLATQEEETAALAARTTVTKTHLGERTRSQLEERFPLGYLVEIKHGSGAEEGNEMAGWCIGGTGLRIEVS